MKLKVDGIDVVLANMERFSKVSRAESDIAVRKTALDIHRAEIKYLNLKTKRHTGRLAQIIVAMPEAGTAVVEPTAPYAEYIEYGTRPHIIRPRNKKVLASRQGGFTKNGIGYGIYNIFGTEVRHPGTAARPFVAPAVSFGEKQFIKHMEAALAKALS